jgi:hypothetical protein
MGTPRYCIVDLNFLLLAKVNDKSLCLVNECTLREYRISLLHGISRSQTFHIHTEENILAYARVNFAEQICYNRDKFHKIPSEYGSTSFSHFCEYLKQEVPKYQVVFTKGSQKVSVIKAALESSTTTPVLDLDTFSCPSILNLNAQYPVGFQLSCSYHESTFIYCTAYKADLLSRWMRDNHSLLEKKVWIQEPTFPILPTVPIPDYYFQLQQQQQHSHKQELQQQQQQQYLELEQQQQQLQQQQQQQKQQQVYEQKYYQPDQAEFYVLQP